ncbi:hypothetical protein OAP18_03185 [Gammaproteobacteria bacterium]|nr:hypothetical protein [Gammaproteobacteria bacterium]
MFGGGMPPGGGGGGGAPMAGGVPMGGVGVPPIPGPGVPAGGAGGVPPVPAPPAVALPPALPVAPVAPALPPMPMAAPPVPPYVGPGVTVNVRTMNTQGWKSDTMTGERQRLATADTPTISMIQESGQIPANWGGVPVPGQPQLQSGTFPGRGRRSDVHWVAQTPAPGPSGQIPYRNSQVVMSTEPIINPFEVRSAAVGPTQRAAVVAPTPLGVFASQHAVSGAPAVSRPQSRDHWQAMSAAAVPPPPPGAGAGAPPPVVPPFPPAFGQTLTLGGDFNHSHADSVMAAAAIVAPTPIPVVHSGPGPTQVSGGGLDRFWSTGTAPSTVRSLPGMTGDHVGQEMDITTN